MVSWWNVIYKYLFNNYAGRFIWLDNNYVERLGTWRIISIVEKWFNIWTNLIFDVINKIVSFLVIIITTVYLVSSMGFSYLMCLLVFIFLISLFVYHLNKYSLYYRKIRVDVYTEYSRHLIKIIMSKFEILQNNRLEDEKKLLYKDTDRFMELNIKINFYTFFMYSLPRLCVSFILIIIFILIWNKVIDWFLPVSIFVGIMLFFNYVNNMIYEMVEFYRIFSDQITQVQKLWDLFDNAKEIPWLNEWKEFKYINWDIEIKNLKFWYWDNEIFDWLNLDIKWTQKTALVWVSGAGKTTLVKLISWYLSPTGWEIIIDWQKLSETKLISYYSNIWYLTQDPNVFDGSILENLVYGSKEIPTAEQLDTAIKLAKCDFIYDFKDWLDTQIWERWVRLSWWQKQRLAIAKIFLKNPKIIILDEPTSALDSFSEEYVTDAFNNLFEWRTVLVIAHRLQTVKNSDDIIVFEWWKVVERWNHNDLVSHWWIYTKMLELQSGF